MNNSDKQLVGIILFSLACGYTVYRIQSIMTGEKRKRANIEANKVATIKAMQAASDIITEKIRKGEYHHTDLNKVYNDWEFESIIQFNKDN